MKSITRYLPILLLVVFLTMGAKITLTEDMLGTDGSNTSGATAYSVLGAVGTNEATADTPFSSSTVASDADGSVLERQEFAQSQAPVTVTKTLTTIVNGNNNLFTVAGGPVKVIEIIGYVATEIEGKSCLINYNFDPTTPATDTAFGTDGTALEANAAAVGSLLTWNGVVANDIIKTANGVALGCPTTSGIILPPGSLELAAVVSTSATGAITFYVRYIPLDTDSTVTAQ